MKNKHVILVCAIASAITFGYYSSWHWGVHIMSAYLVWDLAVSLVVYVKALNEIKEALPALEAREKKLNELAKLLQKIIKEENNNKKNWN